MIEFMEMIFPHGPREVKRIIIRSATDPQVHKLKEGKLTFYQGIIHKLRHVLNTLAVMYLKFPLKFPLSIK